MPIIYAKLNRLKALITDGRVIYGEKQISSLHPRKRIKKLYLIGKDVKAYPLATKAIKEADVIILGPGSLYTSIISNLLVPGIKNAIISSNASKVYIANIMTQPGETDGYELSDHLGAIKKYSGIDFDHVLVNKGSISAHILKKYRATDSVPVNDDLDALDCGYVIHRENYVSSTHFARHSPLKLSRDLMKIITCAPK